MENSSIVKLYKQKEEEKRKFKDSLPYSLDYIEWLEKFTTRFGSFSTDTFLYDRELISQKDRDNVDHLETLFEEIYDYANENYVDRHKLSYGFFYSIQHNGIGYSIGVDYGQGCSFYCERLEKPDPDALEYEQIMSSVKLPNTIFWDLKLDELVEVIEKLHALNVPVEAMEKVANETFEKIKTKKKR